MSIESTVASNNSMGMNGAVACIILLPFEMT